ncbi:hypothetical protein T265_09906 [Opisthorchis viverrini]|uniref:GIY-YIG domain-containing protein n=1 Tax=Opisthorchis viverrini TaxID=6198 RepID=A0A074Z458_OPIVI|nr:hypothetical protein T265_09906 [Opisthorchis viverrini]KER21876.1 hypothetical protein T265_09906 [Opisthorchis viverrini]
MKLVADRMAVDLFAELGNWLANVSSPVEETSSVRMNETEIKGKLRDSGYPARRQLRRMLVPVAKIQQGMEWNNVPKEKHSALVQLKDHPPSNRNRDCAYKIKYSDCGRVCTGQTVGELQTRIGQHRRKSNRSPRGPYEYRALLKDAALMERELDTGRKQI